jgi:site-specific recombinase XerD
LFAISYWKEPYRHVKKANDRPYTHQEIHKLLEYSTPRERVLVLLMCSAGLRIGGLPGLNVGHLRKIKKYNIYELTVYAGEPEEYKTFCSVECAESIDEYLQYRQVRLGGTITEESPLLTNLTQKETRHRKNPGTRMSINGIRHLVDRLLYDTGLRRTDNKGKTKRYITATCHSLRKFMRSQLHFAGVDHLHAETLVGHSTGLVGVYTKISDDDLLKSYLQAIPNLTINEEERQKQIVKE